MRVSWEQVSARRLERQFLASPGGTAAEVVRAMCGAHAQVMSAAELSVGLRLDGATRDDVRAALWEERSVVKTFGPRGTVHLLPTEDLPFWTGALSAVPNSGVQFPPEVRMTPEQTDEVVQAVAKALAEDDLTLEELDGRVVELAGAWAGDRVMEAFQDRWPRWRQAISTTARAGVLCYGPNRGRKLTYTNPHRWLPGFKPMEGKKALAELVRRYLHAYGPATPQQFAKWLGAPSDWARTLFEGVELEQVELDGQPAWIVASDATWPGERPSGVRLLPYFDAYVVGSYPRRRLFPGKAAERALAGGQAGNFPVLMVDGVVAGVWHQRRSGRRLVVTVEPLGRLTAAQRKLLDEQVELVGRVLDGRPELTVGKVTVGPHA
jgi:uncharacterized protein YukE